MGFLFKCFFWFMVVVLTWHFLTRKYLNPYKLTMVFGKKGSGKSTLMVRMAYEYLASGWTVFCTEKLDGCIHIDYNDIGFKKIPPESLLLVDEVGMIWDNRNFKNFKPEVRDWFKLQRHYKVKVVLFSQTFDIDKKLRDLTDDMFLCTNVLRVFSWAKRITRRVVLVQPGPDTPARIDEELAYDSLLWWPFGSRILTFIPSWAPFFDSHNCPELPAKKWTPEPELKLPKKLQKARKKASRKRRSRLRNKSGILLRWKLETPVSSMVTQGDGWCQGPLLFLLRWGTSAMLLDDFAGPCYHDRSFNFGGCAMQFSELATERFSVLEYEHRSVAQEAVDQILAAGMAAPTACIIFSPSGSW